MRARGSSKRLTLILVNLAAVLERADEALLPAVYDQVLRSSHLLCFRWKVYNCGFCFVTLFGEFELPMFEVLVRKFVFLEFPPASSLGFRRVSLVFRVFSLWYWY